MLGAAWRSRSKRWSAYEWQRKWDFERCPCAQQIFALIDPAICTSVAEHFLAGSGLLICRPDLAKSLGRLVGSMASIYGPLLHFETTDFQEALSIFGVYSGK
jgi:hypothetical protein